MEVESREQAVKAPQWTIECSTVKDTTKGCTYPNPGLGGVDHEVEHQQWLADALDELHVGRCACFVCFLHRTDFVFVMYGMSFFQSCVWSDSVSRAKVSYDTKKYQRDSTSYAKFSSDIKRDVLPSDGRINDFDFLQNQISFVGAQCYFMPVA